MATGSRSSGGYFSSFFFLFYFSFRSFFDLRNDHTVYTHKSSCTINLMKLDGAIEVNKLHLFSWTRAVLSPLLFDASGSTEYLLLLESWNIGYFN